MFTVLYHSLPFFTVLYRSLQFSTVLYRSLLCFLPFSTFLYFFLYLFFTFSFSFLYLFFTFSLPFRYLFVTFSLPFLYLSLPFVTFRYLSLSFLHPSLPFCTLHESEQPEVVSVTTITDWGGRWVISAARTLAFRWLDTVGVWRWIERARWWLRVSGNLCSMSRVAWLSCAPLSLTVLHFVGAYCVLTAVARCADTSE